MLVAPFTGDWGNPTITLIAIPSLLRTLADLSGILIISLFLSLFIGIYLQFTNNPPVIFQGNWLLIAVSTGIVLLLPYLQQNYRFQYIWDGYEQQFYIGTSFFYLLVVITSLLFLSRVLYELSRVNVVSNEIDVAESERMVYPQANSKLIQQNTEFGVVSENNWYLLLSAVKSSLPHLFGYYILTSYILNIPNLATFGLFNFDYIGWQFLFIFIFLFLYSCSHFLISFVMHRLKINEERNLQLNCNQSTIRTIFSNIGIIFYLLILIFSVMLYVNRRNLQISGSFLFYHSPDGSYQRYLGVMQQGFVLGTDYQGRDLFANLTLSVYDLFGALLIGLCLRTFISIMYLSVGSKSQILTKIVNWMAFLPKFPVLLLIALFAFSDNIIILFYVLTALIFTPNSLIVTYSSPTAYSNSLLREKFRMIRAMIFHFILSITIEIILVVLIFRTFTPDILSIGDIVRIQAQSFPSQRPLQSAFVFLFPFLIVSPWYLKHDLAVSNLLA